MSSLTDTLISDTFDSLIHSNGLPIPISGLVDLYDGAGSKTSVSLGREGSGMTVTGKITTDLLKVGGVNYPSINGNIGNFVYQESATQWGYLSQIPTDSLQDLSPSPANVYGKPIFNISVNPKGLVTNINQIEDYGSASATIPHGSPHSPVTSSPIVLSNINEWVKIDLTNDGSGSGVLASVFSDTKAITGFLRSEGKVIHGGKTTNIQATYDKSDGGPKFPVIYDIPNDSTDNRGLSNTFYCPVVRETVGGVERAYIYLRNAGASSDTSVNPTSWRLSITIQHI